MRIRTAAALVLAASLLAACGESDGSSSAPSAPAGATTPAATTAATTGAGALLTAEQTRAALPTVADLPTGWSAAPYDDSDDDSETRFQPAECNDLLDSFENEKDTTVHEDGVTFKEGGELGTELTAEVATHSDTFEKDKIAGAIKDVLAKCATMTSDVNGQPAKVAVSELSVPQLGEGAYGLRMEIAVGGMVMTGDIAMVGVGHNSLIVNSIGLAPLAPAELDKVVRASFAKLEKAGGAAA